LDDFRELDEPIGAMDAQFLLGSLASVSGDVGRALELAQATLVACEQFGERWWRTWVERNLAVALWRAGDRNGSREAVLRALRDCRDLNEQLCGALCLEVCAWIAAAERQYPRAAVLFGATRGVWEALSTTPFWQLTDEDFAWERVTRLALGDAAFAAGFAEGLQLATEDALDYGLGHVAHAPDAATNRRRGGGSSLTPRELEVAQYVAEGMNNKEIASRLVISRRTAETHVEHILAKLGFTSRAQIAAWVAEHRRSTQTAVD
jgi:DNA-binding CsgD family transcriptional regulator